MESDFSFLIDLFSLFILIFFNGVFIAAEYSIVRSNPHAFTNGGKNKPGSKTALKVIEESDLTLSAAQLGVSFFTILIGFWGYRFISGLFSLIPLSLQHNLLAPIYLFWLLALVGVILITYFCVVFSELFAKSIAITAPESTLRFVAGFIYLFSQLARPFIFVLNRSATFFAKLCGIKFTAHSNQVRSLSELSYVLNKSTEGGILNKEEGEMLKGIITLSDTVAREIMTPRTDLIVIPIDSTLEEATQIVKESGLSRFPVEGESVDDIQGMVLARDILNFMAQNQNNPSKFSVAKVMREPYFIPGTMQLDELLGEFKKRKLHQAIVLDEHGGVDGVVTLEDLIEEIVGDIFDESDVPEAAIDVQENGEALIDGGELIADVNNQFNLNIPEGDYDTIAGFIFTKLGRMPKAGDIVVVDKMQKLFSDSEEDVDIESYDEDSPAHEELVNEENGATHKAVLKVEIVHSHRIEKVRLKPYTIEQFSESVS
ncbi:MAG: HlyC/CorC family transporter [Proteobacteria bacterium]|nr:HlyC/CorC family transporter [Pseudomonadota bacterium]